MIGLFEGALSSRRKRANIIIRRRGKKSRKSFVIPRRRERESRNREKMKNAGCFLNSRKGGK
jgi:hypothetical protein